MNRIQVWPLLAALLLLHSGAVSGVGTAHKSSSAAEELADASRPRLMREASIDDDGIARSPRGDDQQQGIGRSMLAPDGSVSAMEQELVRDTPASVPIFNNSGLPLFKPAYQLPDDLTPYQDTVIAKLDIGDQTTNDDYTACTLSSSYIRCFFRTQFLQAPRLGSPKMKDAAALGQLRPDWMAHPTVQATPLFSLTWPGTIDSGTYNFASKAGFSRQTQTLDINNQLFLGVRAFDLSISWDSDSNKLYVSNMFLAVPLLEVLFAFRDFLRKYPSEVLLVRSQLDPDAEAEGAWGTAPFLQEQQDPYNVLPGEGVNTAFANVFAGNISTYFALQRLGNSSSIRKENPTIQQLLSVNIRIVLFWEQQQVLCITLQECTLIPDWERPLAPEQAWQPTIIGPGGRTPSTNNTAVEPACLMRSETYGPISTVLSPEDWSDAAAMFLTDPRTAAKQNRPGCMPLCYEKLRDAMLGGYLCASVPPPFLGQPAMMYWLEAKVPGVNDNFPMFSTSARTSAERVNYLMLSRILSQHKRTSFGQANVIAFAFVAPILLHRIIEANQGLVDCGFSVACKISGSCISMSYLNPNLRVNMTCMPNAGIDIVLMDLQTNMKVLNVMRFSFLGVCICLACCSCCLTGWGFKVLSSKFLQRNDKPEMANDGLLAANVSARETFAGFETDAPRTTIAN